MKTKLKVAILLLAASFILSGCFPTLCTKQAGVSGKVIDGKNNQPVVSATVILVTNSIVENQTQTLQTLQTSTDTNGRFEIKPVQEMCLYIVPMDPYPQFGKVTISAGGYEEVTTDFRTSTMGPGTTNLKVITLVPHNDKL